MHVMIDETSNTVSVAHVEQPAQRTNYWKIALMLIAALGLNLVVLMIPLTWIEGLRGHGTLAYLAAFAITALANASVIVPIPYPGLIALLARVMGSPFDIAIAGAAGSTLGETTAFIVGRVGKTAVEDTRFYRWLKHQLRTPLRAFVILFLLSAPPNPFFDVAGLTAGSLGVPFWIFAVATFLGRILKMLFFTGLGQQFLT
jgi:uncharacterized membrane protein YdjX (TVP38/TMEM64 family)